MADTDQVEIPADARALAEELNFGPEDLLKLPDYIKLAKELGLDLKDLLVNKNTSAISVVNRTQHTLHFMSESREHNGQTGAGALKILPPNQIGPGETGTFLSGESPSSFLGLGGDEGWVVYAVGAPEHSQWTIHWNNPEGKTPGEDADNHADAEIVFPNGQTEPDGTVIDYKFTVAFAQSGSTLVPFEFVLLEEGFGGGPDGVVDKNSCVITIMNETKETLFLNETHFNDGDLVSFPDDEIPPDGQTTFTVSEKLRPDHRREGVSGFARYSVTQDPAHALWTVQWINPETGPNTANDRLDGSSVDRYQTGPPLMPSDQKESTPVRFVLRDHGGGGGNGQPKETPPPETDEPTLRIGDKGVDGWVEYLQELLVVAGYQVKIDGDFGQGTLTAVLRLQHDRNLQHDGIVGNQTWASLRSEDARPPSTDGRVPHTYTEQGPEARWMQEDDWVFYNAGIDQLEVFAFNVGNELIEANKFVATADLVRDSDGTSLQIHLFGPFGVPAAVGEMFTFALPSAGSNNIGPGTWRLHAWLPAELGGDDHNGTFTI